MSCPLAAALGAAAPFFDDKGKLAAQPFINASRLECWGLNASTIQPDSMSLDADSLTLRAGNTSIDLAKAICRTAGEYLLIIDENGDSFCFNHAPTKH
ncbi:hypothetical protein [Erythrobacter aureus]|uniref:Uncharacterized protein n=1 Tax=Erythrobacter aureus TaxID=2182384 RepID=A0A345YIS2_9SPHN|nr:hypothetical protein [Erythrobacter aureus]AXK43824.1 hypothetical protein DVR09_15320 [Erythrobacter aureus]